MTTRNQLDGILASLRSTKEAAMKTAAAKGAADGSKPTSHPIGKAEDNTSAASTGARASENTSDSKAQNALNPDSAGAPKATAPVAGSQGVDAKDATQAPADKPDTSGKSEMGSKDTAHPTKSASELLSDRIKAAKEGTPDVGEAADKKKDGKVVASDANTQKAPEAKAVDQKGHTDEKVAAEKEATEKFAAYCQELIEKHADDFQAGVKFAQEVLEIVATAAAQGAQDGKTAAMDPAMAGGDPAAAMAGGDPAAAAAEGDPAAAMAGAEGGAEGGGDELDQLAAELEAAGVTPEELMQALQGAEEGGGEVQPEGQDEMAALQEAMGAEGMSPEELASAVGGEGGGMPPEADTGAEDAAGAAAAKAASDKHAALVEEYRAQIRTIKAAKAQAKK